MIGCNTYLHPLIVFFEIGFCKLVVFFIFYTFRYKKGIIIAMFLTECCFFLYNLIGCSFAFATPGVVLEGYAIIVYYISVLVQLNQEALIKLSEGFLLCYNDIG